MNIFISNLCETSNGHQLRELFRHFGAIVSVQVIMSNATGKSEKFGFVEMKNNDEGQLAIEALNNMQFMGSYLEVSAIRPKAQK